MITIILGNCDEKLKLLGVDMNETGAPDRFVVLLKEKIVYECWEYGFAEDQLKITVLEGQETVDLSDFGEVLEYVSIDG